MSTDQRAIGDGLCRLRTIFGAWAAAAFLVLTAAAQTNPPSGAEAVLARFGYRETRVHDPSTIVKCKDDYWVFSTGMGIVSRRSKNLLKWTEGPRVFTNTPAWTTNAVPGNRGYFWAPDIIRTGDGYFLYYSISTFGKNRSIIGLATNHTLDPDDPQYEWIDRGAVVESTAQDDFNTIDPAVTQDDQGKLWLAFGSFWSGIKLIQLDASTGKRIKPDSPVYSLARSGAIEAAYIYRHGGAYYLFVNWGACCRGTNSTYNVRVGRSKGITGPYLDRDGKDLELGGGTLLLDSHPPFIGPGHAGILSYRGVDLMSCHFYNGARQGTPVLAILRVHWDRAGWPTVEAQQDKPFKP